MRHRIHDYSQPGGYFITTATYQRQPLLGQLSGSSFTPTRAGEVVLSTWLELPKRFHSIALDAIQLMPDHLHGIMLITYQGQTGAEDEPELELSQIIQSFKGRSARAANRLLGRTGVSLWQRGFHERVIRNETELDKFRNYIVTNPLRASIRSRD